VEIPVSLIVGVLLLSLGVASAAVLRTFMNSGKIVAIEKILEPMAEVHRQAAETRARLDGHDEQIRELKAHLKDQRDENRAEHKSEAGANTDAHDKLVKLILESEERIKNGFKNREKA
jgi:hypothetical protein